MARPRPTPDQRAEALKERVYVTFTALAVVLTLRTDTAEVGAGRAATALTVTVVGTLLAVLVADVVAHITVHRALPGRAELVHMLRVAASASGVLVIPLLLIGLAGFGVIPIGTALDGGAAALALSLVAVGYLALRRLRLPLIQKLIVLLAEFVLGLAVIGLELLAH